MADVVVRVRNQVEGSGEVQSYGQRLSNLFDTIKRGAAAAGIAAVAIKKAFDFAEAGARVTQVTSSFEQMNETVYNTPGLLDDLRAAARNTVQDVDLMSGVLTLTAGTTGEMAQALALASPELVAMSRAASTLNPALGDTTFLFDSLSVAAKRQSRLLADNAGIIVRMDDAIQEVHPSLSALADTYDDLPESLRFLNEMLFQGENLIRQAGEGAESAVDPFERLGVAVRDQIDDWKEWAGEALTPAAEALTFFLAEAEKLEAATVAQGDAIAESADSYDQLVDAAGRVRAGLDEIANSPWYTRPFTSDVEEQLSADLADIVRDIAGTSTSLEDFRQRLMELDEAGVIEIDVEWDRAIIGEVSYDIEQLFSDAGRATDRYSAKLDELARRGREASEPIENIARSADLLAESRLFRERHNLRERLGLTGAAEDVEETDDALGQLAATVDNIVAGAIGDQFDLIDELAEQWGILAEQPNQWTDAYTEASEEITRLNDELRTSYADMMLEIITETGGFDQVAADFAIATGTMTEAQAGLYLRTIETSEALKGIATAVDEGSISPEQGAQIYAGLVSASQDASVDIQGAISQAQQTVARFASGDWIQVGDGWKRMIDPAVTTEGEGAIGEFEITPTVNMENISGLRGEMEEISRFRDEDLNAVEVAPPSDTTEIEAVETAAKNASEMLRDVEGDYPVTMSGNLPTEEGRLIRILSLLRQIDGLDPNVNINTTGGVNVPNVGGGGIGHAHGTGGWLTVPPGHPNDTFGPIYLSTGERYSVQPAGGSQGEPSVVVVTTNQYMSSIYNSRSGQRAAWRTGARDFSHAIQG